MFFLIELHDSLSLSLCSLSLPLMFVFPLCISRYFEVESREAPVSHDCLVLTADRAKHLIDENTIGAILYIVCCRRMCSTTESDIVMQ